MGALQRYIEHLSGIRRYSERTCESYRDILTRYFSFVRQGDDSAPDEAFLTPRLIRSYEIYLLDKCKLSPSTVNLHLSVLSGLCRFLLKEGSLSTNPVSSVSRPRQSKRLPEFYRRESMEAYMNASENAVLEENLELISGHDKVSEELFLRRQSRLIISILYQTGLRRSELVSLNVGSLDLKRKTLRVKGKGNKMREIPLLASLCEEISLYLTAASSLMDDVYEPGQALLRTLAGSRIYPVYVDRVVKRELSGVEGLSGRRSPHVLRHTLATELLDDGTELNSIKELLGHSSLAATQIYTHNSIEKLQKVYNNAHPRAKNGGDYGDKD